MLTKMRSKCISSGTAKHNNLDSDCFAVSTDTFLDYTLTTLRIPTQRTECAFCTNKQFSDLISYSFSAMNVDSTIASVCATKNIKITTTAKSL